VCRRLGTRLVAMRLRPEKYKRIAKEGVLQADNQQYLLISAGTQDSRTVCTPCGTTAAKRSDPKQEN
jgi:hypothetical protein